VRSGDYVNCLKYLDKLETHKITVDNLLLHTILLIYMNTKNVSKAINTFEKFRKTIAVDAANYSKIIMLIARLFI